MKRFRRFWLLMLGVVILASGRYSATKNTWWLVLTIIAFVLGVILAVYEAIELFKKDK